MPDLLKGSHMIGYDYATVYMGLREKKNRTGWGLAKYWSMPFTSVHEFHTYLATYRHIV